MRIAVMVESEQVLIDCDDATSVAEVEHALEERLGRRVVVPGDRNAPAGATLVHGARLGGPIHARRQSAWQIHVTAGPDAGVIWDLVGGDSVLGRSGALRWKDPRISRRHLGLKVDDEVVVTDLDSTHGTRIDGETCHPGRDYVLSPGSMLQIGDSIATLRPAPTVDGVWESSSPGWRRLLRPPRIPSRVETSTIEFPAAMREPETRRLPLATLAVALAAGVGIAALMRRPEFLLFAMVSPSMVLANHVASRIADRRKHAAEAAAHTDARDRAERHLEAALLVEQDRLRDAQPDAAATLMMAVLPGRRLWERRHGDPDYLLIRVGVRDSPSEVPVRGSPSFAPVARLVPQCVDLMSTPILGIVGDEAATDGLLRWVIAQLCCGQAPRDLRLVFLGSPGDDWAWLSWLPHVRSEPATVSERIAALSDLIRRRQGEGGDRHTAVVVVLRAYRDVGRLAGLRQIFDDGPAVGVVVICTADLDSELPEATRAVVTLEPGGRSWGDLRTGDARGPLGFVLEQVSTQWAENFALGLAPFEDADEDEADLARSVGLLDLLAFDPEDVGVALARWRRCPASTAAVIGVASGGPVILDLTRDGPHVLVAGMTGAGKTELLRSLIASLAVANDPRWLTFVLVDYKGDSAFRECADLPHVVGKVNDLDPVLVQRALTSLGAELTRRKGLLAAAGVGDIEGYHDLLAREPRRESLPRLVIVIDEFAELSKELPEFIDGLVSIAQLGRSLGIHLVLATQRPTGVISAGIRANIGLRIALRVADPADSVDVLGVSDAARLPPGRPGRGFVTSGARHVTEFQTARISGASGLAAPLQRTLSIQPVTWEDMSVGGQTSTPAAESSAAPSDLARVAQCLTEAARAESLAPQRPPWLEPLPREALWPLHNHSRLPAVALMFGLSDLPDQQRQDLASFDPARDGHLFVIGAPRSGRSQLLRTLAYAIAEGFEPEDLHLYGLDCGSGALEVLSALPHCGAVVGRSEPDRGHRLLARLVTELDERRTSAAEPRVVVMLDAWEGFLASLAEHGECVDLLMRLLREGPSVGIHVVIAGDRTLLTNARMAGMTRAKYLLRLGERGDYLLAGIPARQAPDDLPPGRCIGPDGVQTQVFLVDADPDAAAQEAAIRRVGAAARHRAASQPGPRPFRLDPLPERISVEEAWALRSDDALLPIVGVGGDELAALAPDPGRSACFPVVGPPRSGRSSVLAAAAESFRARGGQVAVIDAVAGTHGTADGGVPLLVIVDDADALEPSPIDGFLEDVAHGRVPGAFLIASGTPALISRGFTGWRAQLGRAGQGLLLSPQTVVDGDAIGVRLPRRLVGLPVRPGRGLLHRGDGVLVPVATLLPDVAFRRPEVCETVA